MVTTKYLWCLDVLQNLEQYREKDLQECIEYLWDVLFGDYIQCKPSVFGMPNSWQPDIVAYDKNADIWLIIELKGEPPHGNRKKAIAQVCNYAFRLLEKHPSWALRLLIVGPWGKNSWCQYEHDGPYHVAVVNALNLGEELESLFESMLSWCINSPFPLLRPRPIVHEWLNRLPNTIWADKDEEAETGQMRSDYETGEGDQT